MACGFAVIAIARSESSLVSAKFRRSSASFVHGHPIHRAAARRRLDADVVERVVLALVAQRALEPGSKLEACRWRAERVAIEGLDGLDSDAATPAMDFLLAGHAEIACGVFTTATLLSLACEWSLPIRPPRTGSSTAPTISSTWLT